MASELFLLPVQIDFWIEPLSWAIEGKTFVSAAPAETKAGIPLGPEYDALKARTEFLQARTNEQFLRWLNETGKLDDELRIITRDDLLRLQGVIVTRLTDNPMWWYDLTQQEPFSDDPFFRIFDEAGSDLKLSVDFWEGKSVGKVKVESSLDAMAASVVLERGQRHPPRYSVCEWDNCPRSRVFKAKSDHGAKYCSHACARAAGQSRRRAERSGK